MAYEIASNVLAEAEKHLDALIAAVRIEMAGDVLEKFITPALIAAIYDKETRWGQDRNYRDDDIVDGLSDGTGDGGHGHGFGQIDDRSHKSFLKTGKWTDRSGKQREGKWFKVSDCVAYSCDLLCKNWLYIEHRVPRMIPSTYLQASVAAYNAGAGRIVSNLKGQRDIDHRTAHNNYSHDVFHYLPAWERVIKDWTTPQETPVAVPQELRMPVFAREAASVYNLMVDAAGLTRAAVEKMGGGE